MALSSILNSLSSTPTGQERDLCASATPRDENAGKKSVRRSFSWGKSKKRAEKRATTSQPGKTEVISVVLSRAQATSELGLELHEVTGDVIVSYVGSIPDISIGDCILAIEGLELLYPGGPEKLEAARQVLADPTEGEEDPHAPQQTVELTVEKNSIRTEVLKRHAALRGTSLDRLGLTLCLEDSHIVVSEMDPKGLASKQGRIATGDRLVGINGRAVKDLEHAIELLQSDDASELEVELDLMYGFLVPENHEFSTELGCYVPAKKPLSGLARVKRSLSFGKKKKPPPAPEPTLRTAESASTAPELSSPDPEFIPEPNMEPRLLLIPKNEEGRICVTFRAHEVTGELIISQIGSNSPAQIAGAEVGDRVLALQGSIFEQGGEEDLENARVVLEQSASSPTIEMIVQTRVRTERLEFGQEFVGGPKNKLGLTFYSFPNDEFVRITKMVGAAAKSGKFALGDRIVAVNGIRVNHAETLQAHIAEFCKRDEYVDFEVALGYQPEEGLWYGKDVSVGSDEQPEEKKKPKRSFSFGRRTVH